ncbi:hypothetical protein [Carboxylicivirga linearis]|uniref:STAS domain-containing protein n=1 Tax=Carboxylicivirga linearis TaxID=1628157 RepID=A0ABS5JPP3_9BACT|nr:hypothetical protein [Carboxylicivirga linearis]MBS2096815.1 hypothetical protein [Carboxylicivirga linearis]
MDNLPYNVIYEELPEKEILRFSGQLIINYIENITEAVKNKVSVSKDLDVQIDNPDSIDVTFIQLLLSIIKTFEANDKNVSVTSELKDELKTLIGNSGFSYVLN